VFAFFQNTDGADDMGPTTRLNADVAAANRIKEFDTSNLEKNLVCIMSSQWDAIDRFHDGHQFGP
jgi:hypothetical protein